MTKKEINAIRHAAYLEWANGEDAKKLLSETNYDIFPVYKLVQGQNVKYICVAPVLIITDNLLKECGFDAEKTEVARVFSANRQTETLDFRICGDLNKNKEEKIMNKIMCATLIPCQASSENGEILEYQWIESSEVDGAIGWDNAAAFVSECLDDMGIVENPSFAIHNLPQNAVIVTATEGEEGHNKAFEIYWVENADM